MRVPKIEQISSSWYQSRLLRAKREASKLSTRPARARLISASSRWKPPRASACAPDLPRSSSMISTRCAPPSERNCSLDQGVLEVRALCMARHLHERGLSNGDVGHFRALRCRGSDRQDLSIHRCTPCLTWLLERGSMSRATK